MNKKLGRSQLNQTNNQNQQSLHSKTGISQKSIDEASTFILGRASQHFPVFQKSQQDESKMILREKNLPFFLNTIVKKLPPPNNKTDIKSALDKMKKIADKQEKTIQKDMANVNKDFFDDEDDLDNYGLVEDSQYDEQDSKLQFTESQNIQQPVLKKSQTQNDETQKQIKQQQMQRASLKRRLQNEKENINFEINENTSYSSLNIQKSQSSTLSNKSNYYNNQNTNMKQSNIPTLSKKRSSKQEDKKKQQQEKLSNNISKSQNNTINNNINNQNNQNTIVNNNNNNSLINCLNTNNNHNFSNFQPDHLYNSPSFKTNINNKEHHSASQISDFYHNINSNGSLLQPQTSLANNLNNSPNKQYEFLTNLDNDFYTQHKDQIDGGKNTSNISNYPFYYESEKTTSNNTGYFDNFMNDNVENLFS